MKFSEEGHVLPIAAFMVCAMIFVASIVVYTAGAANIEARAQTAADAAALAGAEGGRPAAEAAATINGARLESWELSAGAAKVEVSIDGRSAEARAQASGGLSTAGEVQSSS